MKPSESDYMNYALPDGSSVALFASGDNRAGEWTYFWADFDREELPEVLYRTHLVGAPPGEWVAMKPSGQVFKLTGYKDDEDDDECAQLGAAAKLEQGKYILQARIVIDKIATELPGVTFEVQPGRRKRN